jgi:DtxR family Mn-dependent transcriptional regulator
MVSATVEDYLKSIFLLTRDDAAASTSALAHRLGVAAGTVTGMLKRLSEAGLVEHVPYYGARLTGHGRSQAIALVRRHRLIELFLVEVLGYGWDSVHAEAERLEHAVTDELVDRMASVLGSPEVDPHGAPIPELTGTWEEPSLPSLAEVEAGVAAVVRRVPDQEPETLRYLARLGLVPGARVRVVERAPFDGPVCVEVGRTKQFIGEALSRQLQVEPVTRRETGRSRRQVSGGVDEEEASERAS